jgi:hypothetical protein
MLGTYILSFVTKENLYLCYGMVRPTSLKVHNYEILIPWNLNDFHVMK